MIVQKQEDEDKGGGKQATNELNHTPLSPPFIDDPLMKECMKDDWRDHPERIEMNSAVRFIHNSSKIIQ